MAQPVISTRNRNQWQHIATFLAGFPVSRMLGATEAAASGKRSAAAAAPAAINFGGCVAPATAVPDGNHGDNFSKGVL